MIDIKVELLLDVTTIVDDFFTLDVSLLDGPHVLAPTLDWVDVTADIMNFSINRGRAKDTDSFRAGTATVRFFNDNRKYDPTNLDSEFVNNILPMRQIRIFSVVIVEVFPGGFFAVGSTGTDVEKIQERLNVLGFGPLLVDGIFGTATEDAVIAVQTDKEITVDGIVGPQTWAALFNELPLYRGFVQDWQIEYTEGGITAFTTAICTDTFSILANQELDEIASAFTDDTSGERITRVLNLAEVNFPSDLRDIDVGDTIFGNTTFGENALNYLQLCERSESGSLFTSKDGKLRFVARNTTGTTSQVVFTDVDESLASHIGYEEIEVDYSTEFLFNRIIVAGTTGNEQTATDTDSQTKYQIRTLKRTDLFIRDDTFAQSMADFFVGRFSEPDFRFRSVSLNLNSFRLTNLKRRQVFDLELADRLIIEKTPPGTGTPTTIEKFAVVDSISYNWQPGNIFRVAIGVSSGRSLEPFILNDPVLGVLDENILGL